MNQVISALNELDAISRRSDRRQELMGISIQVLIAMIARDPTLAYSEGVNPAAAAVDVARQLLAEVNRG